MKHTKSSSSRSSGGFTLVEVIVAMLIMAIGLMGLLGMSTSALRIAYRNDEWTNARMLAQSVLESETSAEFDELMLKASGAPHENQEMVYDGHAYQVDTWLVPQGGSRDPIAVSVRVDGGLDPVTVSTVKTFYL